MKRGLGHKSVRMNRAPTPIISAGGGGSPPTPLTLDRNAISASYGFTGLSPGAGAFPTNFGAVFAAQTGVCGYAASTLTGCIAVITIDAVIWDTYNVGPATYYESVKYRFTPSAVGSSWGGATIRGKKVDQDEYATVTVTSAAAWASKVTTASATIPASGLTAGTEVEVDVTAILEEIRNQSEYGNPPDLVTLLIYPNGADNNNNYLRWVPDSPVDDSPQTFLDVVGWGKVGASPTQAELYSATPVHYMPVTQTDIATGNGTLWVVSPTNFTSGRQRINVVSKLDSATLATTYNATKRTLRCPSFTELDPAKFNPNSSGQQWFLGTCYTGQIGAYANGWLVNSATRDLMQVVACAWDPAVNINTTDLWDTYGWVRGDGQWAVFQDAIISNGTFHFQTQLTDIDVTLTGLTPGAGRSLVYGHCWSHVLKRYLVQAWVIDENGAVVASDSYMGPISADPENETSGLLTGWDISNGDVYGRLWVSFDGDARTIWAETALRMGIEWSKGNKCLDPRLMA